MMSRQCWLWPLGLLLLSGCGFMARYQIDREIRDLSAQNDDGVASVGLVKSLPPPPPSANPVGAATVAEQGPTSQDRSLAIAAPTAIPAEAASGELQQVGFEQKDEELSLKQPLSVKQRLFIPKGLPGAEAPDIEIPTDPKEAERYFAKLYPPIPALPPMTPLAPGPEGRPLDLADLQRLGETYSPTIKTAIAAVEAAKAAAYQAGMYPNPEIAYEHDTAETGPAGYPGGYFQQLIVTGGKLTVQQASATMSVLDAKLALRKAKADLWTQVRGNYFAVLVALRGVRYYEALFQFAEYLYEYQIKLMRLAKTAAGYEPMQLRPLVLQARFDIIQARNRFTASWRQLAASMGLPDMPPSQLIDGLDLPMPVFDYDAVQARLVNNTDVRRALVMVQKARYDLRSQKLVPLPDLGVRALVQKDWTTPPNQLVNSAVMYMTIPLWNQNQGGIRQAEWQLAQASAGPSQARLALINTLADAYQRYVVFRQQTEITMQQISDLVRVYKKAWLRNQTQSLVVSFSDLWPIQVTLEGYVSTYIAALGGQWQAAVDVANFLQTPDFYQAGQRQEVPSYPVLEDLLVPLRSYPRAPIARKATGAAGVAASPVAVASRPAPAAPSPEPPPQPSAPANPPAPVPQLPAAPRRTDASAPDP
ncbi:MAG TPA: TolC family protein [Gemmataceae bacterium]|nr:TolC family protein [Gemmataceae bacterium]